MATSLAPPDWVILPSFFVAVLIGVELMVFLNLFNTDLGKESPFKVVLIYFGMTPVIIFAIWMSLIYTFPATFVNISGEPYRHLHTIVRKKINCSKSCNYWIEMNDLKPFLKFGTKVSKRFYDAVEIDNDVIVEGKKGLMGIRVKRITVVPEGSTERG